MTEHSHSMQLSYNLDIDEKVYLLAAVRSCDAGIWP